MEEKYLSHYTSCPAPGLSKVVLSLSSVTLMTPYSVPCIAGQEEQEKQLMLTESRALLMTTQRAGKPVTMSRFKLAILSIGPIEGIWA